MGPFKMTSGQLPSRPRLFRASLSILPDLGFGKSFLSAPVEPFLRGDVFFDWPQPQTQFALPRSSRRRIFSSQSYLSAWNRQSLTHQQIFLFSKYCFTCITAFVPITISALNNLSYSWSYFKFLNNYPKVFTLVFWTFLSLFLFYFIYCGY